MHPLLEGYWDDLRSARNTAPAVLADTMLIEEWDEAALNCASNERQTELLVRYCLQRSQSPTGWDYYSRNMARVQNNTIADVLDLYIPHCQFFLLDVEARLGEQQMTQEGSALRERDLRRAILVFQQRLELYHLTKRDVRDFTSMELRAFGLVFHQVLLACTVPRDQRLDVITDMLEIIRNDGLYGQVTGSGSTSEEDVALQAAGGTGGTGGGSCP